MEWRGTRDGTLSFEEYRTAIEEQIPLILSDDDIYLYWNYNFSVQDCS